LGGEHIACYLIGWIKRKSALKGIARIVRFIQRDAAGGKAYVTLGPAIVDGNALSFATISEFSVSKRFETLE